MVQVSHWEAMSNPATAKVIGELAREKLARWNRDEVEQARRVVRRYARHQAKTGAAKAPDSDSDLKKRRGPGPHGVET